MTTDTEIARSTLASFSNLFTDLRGDTYGRERQLDIMEEMVTNCVLHLCSTNDSFQRSICNYDILIKEREETSMLQEEKIKLQEEKIKLQEEKIKNLDESNDIFRLIAKDALRNQLELQVDNNTLSDKNKLVSMKTRRKCTIKTTCPGYYSES